MRRCLCLMSFFLIFLGSSTSFADGKVYSRTLVLDGGMPSQRALIIDGGEVETLIIQPTLSTPVEEIAWVIPVPARPEVTAAGNNVFGSLQSYLQPDEITGSDGHIFIFFGWLCVLAVAMLVFFRARTFWYPVVIFSLLLGFFFFGALGLSYLKGSDATSVPGISVVETQRIGILDVTVFSGESGATVLDWLVDEGFQLTEADQPVLQSYVDQGWFFVAAMVAPELQDISSTPSPLRIDFPLDGDEAVYPMALTGSSGDPLELELWVISESRVDHPALEVVRSMPVNLTTFQSRPRLDGVSFPENTWVSLLRGVVQPDQMRDDFHLSPNDGAPYREYCYTSGLQKGLFAWLALSLLLCVSVWVYGRSEKRRRTAVPKIFVTLLIFSWLTPPAGSIAAMIGDTSPASVESGNDMGDPRNRLFVISRAQDDYHALDADGDGVLTYAESVEELIAAGSLAERYSSEIYRGYRFQIQHADETSWSATADPVVSGYRSFYIDETGETRGSLVLEEGGHADGDDEVTIEWF